MAIKKAKKIPVKKRKTQIKKAVKKPAVRAKAVKTKPRAQKKRKAAPIKIKDKIIGVITHYFPKVRAAVVKVKTLLSIGDNIRIKGHTSNFTQIAESMQIDKNIIKSAKKGQEIGLLVNSRVRQGDIVYKI